VRDLADRSVELLARALHGALLSLASRGDCQQQNGNYDRDSSPHRPSMIIVMKCAADRVES
jgi:hypothetical protein